MNHLTTEAYKHSFSAIFKTTSPRHPSFSVGGSLEGVLVKWSDAQLQGLEKAVGKDVANKVVKGCQVSELRLCDDRDSPKDTVISIISQCRSWA